jgi:Calcineurin-like phosphoesterase
MTDLRAALPPGPLDLVGDIHGEIDVLLHLLRRLGCDPERRRVERPLVFVGDLVDRGPDSPAVVELVARLVEAGVAQVVLGNHELNLLRGERKEGNGWFWGDPDDGFYLPQASAPLRIPFTSAAASPAQRQRFLEFFRSLPLVLEREELRVVHAAWNSEALASLPARGDVADLTTAFEVALRAQLDSRGIRQAAEEQRDAWERLRRPDLCPDRLLEAVAEEDEAEQLGNPVKLLTSGPEKRVPLARIFYAGGKWRFVERVRWWRRYRGAPAVVVGHYWRRRSSLGEQAAALDDVFAGTAPWDWLGPRGRVFCVDYGVGLYYRERAQGRDSDFSHGLAAMRWPERKLVFADRERPVATVGWGGK